MGETKFHDFRDDELVVFGAKFRADVALPPERVAMHVYRVTKKNYTLVGEYDTVPAFAMPRFVKSGAMKFRKGEEEDFDLDDEPGAKKRKRAAAAYHVIVPAELHTSQRDTLMSALDQKIKLEPENRARLSAKLKASDDAPIIEPAPPPVILSYTKPTPKTHTPLPARKEPKEPKPRKKAEPKPRVARTCQACPNLLPLGSHVNRLQCDGCRAVARRESWRKRDAKRRQEIRERRMAA